MKIQFSDNLQNLLRRFSDKRYVSSNFRQNGLEAIQKGERSFPFFKNIVHRHYQPNHLQRYLLVADQFSQFFGETVLDVGSRNNILEELLKKKCSLVDKNNPDLPPFDWEKEFLPYPENSFDTIVCLDTLEHINDLHQSFDDLLRVTRKYLIISLPNCWRKTIKEFLGGRGTSASYGLPPEKPFDRHKWFMNSEDIAQFMFYKTAVSFPKPSIKRMVYYIPSTTWTHKWLYPLVKNILPERYFKNLFVHTVFVCLEKVK